MSAETVGTTVAEKRGAARGVEAVLTKVLAEHHTIVSGDGHGWFVLCTCGHREPGTDTAAHVAAEQAAALRALPPAGVEDLTSLVLDALHDADRRWSGSITMLELARHVAAALPAGDERGEGETRVDPAWVDKHGDVWTEGADGLMHTPETRPFPREHVELKWGPLRPVEVPAAEDQGKGGDDRG